MQYSVRFWLNNIALADPVEHRQAALLQVILLIMIGGCLVGLPVSLIVAQRNQLIPLISYPSLIGSTAIALALLRRGHFTAAVGLTTIALMLVITGSLIVSGITSGSILLGFIVPITLAGLLLGRRALVLTSGLTVLISAVVALVQARMPSMIAAAPVASDLLINTLSTFILLISVFSLFLDRFGDSLRQALQVARAREHELEQLHASLEQTIVERTAALQQALCDGERREADLSQTLADLRASQATVRALSAPIIPVLPGVLVAPLIGDLGDERMRTLTQNVLDAIERQRARHIIFDITGVPLIDTDVAQALLQAARAARLLGAQVLLVGMRPEVAQTIVALGVTFGALATYADLREAITTLLQNDRLISPDGSSSARMLAKYSKAWHNGEDT